MLKIDLGTLAASTALSAVVSAFVAAGTQRVLGWFDSLWQTLKALFTDDHTTIQGGSHPTASSINERDSLYCLLKTAPARKTRNLAEVDPEILQAAAIEVLRMWGVDRPVTYVRQFFEGSVSVWAFSRNQAKPGDVSQPYGDNNMMLEIRASPSGLIEAMYCVPTQINETGVLLGFDSLLARTGAVSMVLSRAWNYGVYNRKMPRHLDWQLAVGTTARRTPNESAYLDQLEFNEKAPKRAMNMRFVPEFILMRRVRATEQAVDARELLTYLFSHWLERMGFYNFGSAVDGSVQRAMAQIPTPSRWVIFRIP